MAETSVYVEHLAEAEPLREPVLRSIIGRLQLPRGSQGLDAGCGIGHQAVLLAQAVGPAGHVTGVDVTPDVLDYAAKLVQARSLTARITLQNADVHALPFADAAFDWVWSADCVGYPVSEHLSVLRELTRVVRPGGTVMLLGWTAQCLLPGYALLEARLNAACSAFAPYLSGKPPELQFARARGWFREAGLVDVQARTFVGDVQPPVSNDIRRALAALFAMLWDTRQAGMCADDQATFQRLCQPASPDFIVDIADYYAFFTYSFFQGTRPCAPSDAGSRAAFDDGATADVNRGVR